MNDVRQLTQEFAPAQYQLALTLQRQERHFFGTVTIEGELLRDSQEVPLHAKDLTITAATVDGVQASTSLHGDELSVTTGSSLAKGAHTIELAFEATITDALHGLYPCYYTYDGQEKEILCTQFESHHAREVFPCVDEPAAKAVFDMTLTTEKDVAVIANTPARSHSETSDTQTLVFEPTPKMSTYLLAFVVGELEYREATTNGGVQVRAYATPGQADFTAFPLEVAVRALDFYNDYFGLPYPLAKCDLIGVPDFSAGAMENWGCITFRESCFLVDEKNSDVTTKQFAAQVVIHELAHQWFGNLVTMQWWNDLWLNEGFARFMESFVADRLFPDWNLRTEFLAGNVAVAQRADGLANTHPIQVTVHHPDEISTIFDAISYEKGAAALQMLHEFLGEEDFQKGLSQYLAAHQYQNAITDDLWKSLSDASGKDVADFMQKWIAQPGFPVVTVTTDGKLQLSQERFFANPSSRGSESATWPIPLLAGDELPALMSEPTLSAAPPQTKPFKINRGQVGFYFTAYTTEQRAEQKQAIVDGKMNVEDRLGLLNELFELADAGYVPTREALDFMEAFAHETNEHVWGVVASQLGSIRLLAQGDDEMTAALNKYVVRLVGPQLQKLGWDSTDDEPLTVRSLRQLIVGLACRAEEPSAVAEAKRRFDAAKHSSDLPADLRTTIYATVVRHGDEKLVNTLLERYRHETFSEERINLSVGACASEVPGVATKLLAFMQNAVKTQDVMFWYAYLIRNRTIRATAWQWTKDNWPWIEKTFGSDKSYDRFPKYAASTFTTREQQTDFNTFYEPKKDMPALTRAIAQAQERIDINVQWRERDYETIKQYLLSK